MFWEKNARETIHRLIEEAQFDDIRGTIILPSHHNDGFHWGAECSTFDELHQHLTEIYNEEWYAYVPFENGMAVFEDNAWDAIGELLTDNSKIEDFFERNTKPENTQELVVAKQLLKDPVTSQTVRVSLNEINDELIKYLAKNPTKMREMSPRKFEELVAEMFRDQGFKVELTPLSNDGGMDVVAVQRDGFGTMMIIVECKRFSEHNKVGVGIARGLYGVVEQKRATRGIIATTSFFTRDVEKFHEKVSFRLGLSDFNALTQDIEEWKNRIESK